MATIITHTWNGAPAIVRRCSVLDSALQWCADETCVEVHLPNGHPELGYAAGSEFNANTTDPELVPMWRVL